MRDALLDTLPEITSAARPRTRMVGVNEKGYRVGGDHQRAKLTDHEVDLIRELYEGGGISMREIAEKFEISKGAVSDILSYRRRASIPVDFKMVKVKEAVVTEHQKKMETKKKIRDWYHANHATPMEGVAAGINRHTGLPHVSAREIERNKRRAAK